MIKREYVFLLILITVLLGLFSCAHKSAGGALSLSEAENKISADADAVLQLWKFKRTVPDSAARSLNTASEMTAAPSGDRSLLLSEGDKGMIHDGGNTNRSFSPDTATASSYNKFAYDFLAASYRKAEEPNMIVSPLSLEMLLSVLANGANREALEEILRYLHAPSLKALNDLNAGWLRLSKHPGDHCDFSLANSMWISDEVKLESMFKNEILNTYEASFHTLNPDPILSQEEINLWADEKTHGLIPNFLQEPLKEEIKLALYNATYFNADWRIPFAKYDTSISAFHTSSGVKEVETMNGVLPGDDYYLSERYQAIDIPYSSKLFRMRVILPKKEYTMEEVLRNLANDTIVRTPRAVIVSLPKFKIRHRMEHLTGLLKASGLRSLFANPTSLSSMTSFPNILRGIDLCQETVIECNERGTQVASVTGSGMATSTGERIEYIHFKVDRPFIFMIQEKKSGAVMFAGIVRDPTKQE